MKRQSKLDKTTAQFEKAVQSRQTERYVLRLYVVGLTPRSTAAIQSVKRTCEEYLKDRYELEVVDVARNPSLAKGEQIIAAPTLIKKLPLPLRRLIGDMADEQKILLGLDLVPKKRSAANDAQVKSAAE